MEHLHEILVPLIFFGFLGAIIIVPRVLKSKERQAMQLTIRAAIERGQPLPPEVLEAMTRNSRPEPSAGRDLRSGIVWLFIGIGFAAFGVLISYEPGADDARYPLLGIAAIPGCIGLAFLAMALFNRGNKG
jgi:hypothetical protein